MSGILWYTLIQSVEDVIVVAVKDGAIISDDLFSFFFMHTLQYYKSISPIAINLFTYTSLLLHINISGIINIRELLERSNRYIQKL